jgi:Domain of unknown function (DUF4184)
MPLTLPTHPVAVLPLKLWRPRWFDGVALVVGATAPDLVYATYGFGMDVRTHNLLALWWWSLPVTLIAVRLVRWVAPAVATHLPQAGPLRLPAYGSLSAARHPWYVTVSSALLGAASHLAWDAITHPGYLAILQRDAWPGTPWWGLLSDASNLAGFAAGTLLLLRLGRGGLLRCWHGPPPRTAPRPAAFWFSVAAAFGGGLTAVLVHPAGWVAGQAVRILLIGAAALLCGAAATRLAPARTRTPGDAGSTRTDR